MIKLITLKIKKHPFSTFVFIACQLCFHSSSSIADPIEIGGFFSSGITHANKEKTFLRNHQIEKKTNYLADTFFGLQLSTMLSKESRFSAQLIARDKSNSFEVEAQWLFVSHQLTHNLELRAGRLRLPNFLHSETLMVGQSYLWVRPPLELYSLFAGTNRYNGVSSIFKQNLMGISIEAESYLGQIKDTITLAGSSTDLNTEKMFGGQLSFITDYFTFRMSQTDTEVSYQVPSIGSVISDLSIQVVGLSFNLGNVGGSWEWGIGGGTRGDIRARYYALYYSFDRLTPIITYGANDTDSINGLDSYEGNSLTLGLRYDLTEISSFKLQVLKGAMLDPVALVFSPPVAGFDDDVTVYSLTFNFIY
ncbi:MAG: hypothetical protein KUG82_16720 [Pseudomonadales bacterium]|nr:hypothetical protein [Pseudomonadales bacterium]